jgi:hypothetical protein
MSGSRCIRLLSFTSEIDKKYEKIIGFNTVDLFYRDIGNIDLIKRGILGNQTFVLLPESEKIDNIIDILLNREL